MATELLSSCPQSKQLNPENASLPGSLLTRRQAALLMMDGECGSLMSLENSRVLRLRGRCDSYMLREELSRIFARCPELRTSFVRTSSGDYEPLTPTEERVDFGCLAVEAKDESSMRAALLREAMMPLSLEGGPLFRARLISACSEESYLLLTAHPAVADGYSLSVILVELIGRLSLTEGMEVLSGEALHRSLLVREAAMAQGVEAGKLHGYWEEMADKLEGFGEALTPVADGEVRARRAERMAIQFGAEISTSIRELAASLGVGADSILLSVVLLFLRRYTGRRDAVVPFQIRETGGAIGSLSETAYVEMLLSADQSIAELIGMAARSFATARERFFPSVHSVSGLLRKRGLAAVLRGPLSVTAPGTLLLEPHVRSTPFQELLNALLCNDESAPCRVGVLEVSAIALGATTVWFDLQVGIRSDTSCCRILVDYDTTVFDASMQRRMKKHLDECVRFILERPAGRVSESPVISTTDDFVESRRSRERVGDYLPFSDQEQSLAERFMLVSDKFSSQIAIRSKRATWTYQQFRERALRVAGDLKRRGCKNGDRVIIATREPEETLTAIFGALLIGCVYVPVQPDFPAERLLFVLSDTSPSCVIVGKDDISVFSTLNSGVSLSVSEELAHLTPLEWNQSFARPQDPASILYTSGSTGRPKGVVQNNRNLMFHVRVLSEVFDIRCVDTQLLIAPLIFDGSTTDVFCTLLNGATLVPFGVREEGMAGLAQAIQDMGITLYHSTPTTYRHLLDALPSGHTFRDMRVVILGGEPVNGSDCERFSSHFGPDCLFVNGYGATETSGFVALHAMKKAELDVEKGAVVPIGYPPSGFQLVLVGDEGMEAFAQGALYVKSRYVALGYWNDEELTQKVYSSQASAMDARIYRTGDLAFRSARGKICLAGRIDRQIKVRGHRIDPAEVEAGLASIEGVRESVVVPTFPQDRGAVELSAYLVMDPRIVASNASLRRALAERLPAYLIPTTIVMVDAFPLTSTGKIDVRLLQKQTPIQRVTHGQRPESHLQNVVAAAWGEVLSGSDFVCEDNFFDVGGHSLLLAKVHLILQRRLGVTFPLLRLFENPSIREMADLLASLHVGTTKLTNEFDEIERRMNRRRNNSYRG